ncbi:thiolase domain-containing protein [Martelella sp. FLE1502]
MKLSDSGYIVGAYEHPIRKADTQTIAQLHAEVARGALEDAGLTIQDIDGYACAGDAPGLGPLSMVEYLGINPRYVDTTETGGSSYLIQVAHMARAIAAGKCTIGLITQAGKPRTGIAPAAEGRFGSDPETPDVPYELPFRPTIANIYGMCANRHMHEFGTTSEQLAWIKVAASQHAQHNPHAMLPKPVTVEEVLASPIIADPLHRLDCCVVSDGGGAVIVTSAEVAKSLKRPLVRVKGSGEAVKHLSNGKVDLTFSGGVRSGAEAYAEAGVTAADIKYASIYDSFTITVLITLEDLGFCAKGEGGRFVADGGLISGTGRLPVNTDGGGLCNNHPANRGGMIKILEAVRQLRGEAHPAVQVRNCDLALAHGTGGYLGTRHGSATLVLERV